MNARNRSCTETTDRRPWRGRHFLNITKSGTRIGPLSASAIGIDPDLVQTTSIHLILCLFPPKRSMTRRPFLFFVEQRPSPRASRSETSEKKKHAPQAKARHAHRVRLQTREAFAPSAEFCSDEVWKSIYLPAKDPTLNQGRWLRALPPRRRPPRHGSELLTLKLVRIFGLRILNCHRARDSGGAL